MNRACLAVWAFCICATAFGAVPEAGLKAWYAFDEGSGDVLHDRSGHMNHGKIVGAKVVRHARYVTFQVISPEWDEKMDNPAEKYGHD